MKCKRCGKSSTSPLCSIVMHGGKLKTRGHSNEGDGQVIERSLCYSCMIETLRASKEAKAQNPGDSLRHRRQAP